MKRSGRAQTAQLRLCAAQTAPQYRVHERSSRARSVAPRPRPVGEGVSEGLAVSRLRGGISKPQKACMRCLFRSFVIARIEIGDKI